MTTPASYGGTPFVKGDYEEILHSVQNDKTPFRMTKLCSEGQRIRIYYFS
jgi:hypothetical protein